MYGRIAITLLAFVAQAHAEDLAGNRKHHAEDFMDDLVDKLVNKFIERAILVRSLHDFDLDSTRLAKLTLGRPFARHAFPVSRFPTSNFAYSKIPRLDYNVAAATKGWTGIKAEGKSPTKSDGAVPVQPLTRRHAGLAATFGGVLAAAVQPMPALAAESTVNQAISDLKTAAGVQYRDLQEGNGAKVKKGDQVKVNFILNVINKEGTTSKLQSGKGQVFNLGFNEFIPAFDLALVGDILAIPQLFPMKVGGARQVLAPPSLGYGDARKKLEDGTVIPPQTNLELIVQLLEIVQ